MAASRSGPSVSWAVGVCGLAVFAAVTVAQHVIAPELDPGQHTISEYANARAGWLMTIAFLAWSASLAATVALVHKTLPAARGALAARRLAGSVLSVALAVACAGLLVTAAFKTQTSAGVLPPGVEHSFVGRLHDYGSAIAFLAFLPAVAATVVLISTPRWFRGAAAGALVLAIAADVVLLASGDPVPGLRQRVLVAFAVAWHAALLAVLQRRSRAAAKSAEATDQLRIMSR